MTDLATEAPPTDTVGETAGSTVSDTVGETAGSTVSDTVGETAASMVSDTVGETAASTVSDTVGGVATPDVEAPATLAEALDGEGLVAEIEAALTSDPPDPDSVAVTPVPLDELEAGPVEPATLTHLRFLADIDVQVAVEFGRAHLPLRDLLALGRGQILELDRRVEELVDVLVNGTLVARGEVVLVDGRYGVRIREIVGTGDGDTGSDNPAVAVTEP